MADCNHPDLPMSSIAPASSIVMLQWFRQVFGATIVYRNPGAPLSDLR